MSVSSMTRCCVPQCIAIFASRSGRIIPPLPFGLACEAILFDFADELARVADNPERLAILCSRETMAEIARPLGGDAGLMQFFSIDAGRCSPTTDIIRLEASHFGRAARQKRPSAKMAL
ncbi:hypothetical protein ACS3SW_14250 [Roseobacteraceae bacterium S113]